MVWFLIGLAVGAVVAVIVMNQLQSSKIKSLESQVAATAKGVAGTVKAL